MVRFQWLVHMASPNLWTMASLGSWVIYMSVHGHYKSAVCAQWLVWEVGLYICLYMVISKVLDCAGAASELRLSSM
jgi:hypothetical protein